MRGVTLLSALIGIGLTACAQLTPAEDPTEPGKTAAAALEEQSPRFIGVVGARAQHAPPFLGVAETNFYCLRSFVDRGTGQTLHQLYVSDSYFGAERHWHAAHDGAGRPLRFVEISQNEITCSGGCSYVEEFAADLPEGTLRASPQGLNVIFTAGSGGEMRISVSPAQISAQLAAVDQSRGSLPPVAGHLQDEAPTTPPTRDPTNKHTNPG